ncbi:hypothetical protein BJV74DRAFT_774470 [Russula compacta]|nr:hypothetical protein BJV74DRAFT_774470 [Russula compacta]
MDLETGDKSKPSVVSDCPATGQLDLRYSEYLGSGQHSEVVIAPLTIPSTAAASSIRGSVAVKMADYRENADREMLLREAKIYNAFPRELQEGWHHVPPIVPKFYGYYVPSFEAFDNYGDDDKLSDTDRENVRKYIMRISPILLLEPCGKQIWASDLRVVERKTILALLARLHAAKFVQGSFYQRNILVQPGPLTIPRSERSLNTPSYRIIDFGRGLSPCVNCENMEFFQSEAKEERKRGRRRILHLM